MTYNQFEAFVDNLNLTYGPEPLMLPTEQNLLADLCDLIEKYEKLVRPSYTERLMRLKAICVAAQRYLEDARLAGGGYAGRVEAVIEADRLAKLDLKSLKKTGRNAARNNWLKLAPKVAKSQANQRWNNINKITNSRGGRKIGDHYWKEIFDPRHRPPHFVDGAKSYDDRFKEWHKLVAPTMNELDPRLPRLPEVPNPDYDGEFCLSFFEYLDKLGEIPVGFSYQYLSLAKRNTARVLVKGSMLVRKCGGKFLDTGGWQLNNGMRLNVDAYGHPTGARSYPGSTQSMLTDHGIWVMSTDGEMYTGRQLGVGGEGDMHHSAFLGGAPIRGGGEWLVRKGILKVITGSSGHYRPPFAQFQHALQTMASDGIDLGSVAAEWSYEREQDFHYFNAKQLAQPGVKAEWLHWPKIVGQPLQPVAPLNPRAVSAIPRSVTGTPYAAPGAAAASSYAAPPRQRVNVPQWPPPNPRP